MFDPLNLEPLRTLVDADLTSLPPAEDERFEYKGSATADNQLVTKIQRAASGFWNSGGGFFLAGIDGTGRPDGGISDAVGRQSRRDWVDQAIAAVAPRGSYAVCDCWSCTCELATRY